MPATQIALRIEPETLAALDAMTKVRGLSRNKLIAVAIDDLLGKTFISAAPPARHDPTGLGRVMSSAEAKTGVKAVVKKAKS